MTISILTNPVSISQKLNRSGLFLRILDLKISGHIVSLQAMLVQMTMAASDVTVHKFKGNAEEI